MKRFLGHCMATVTILGLMTVAAPSCVHNDQSLFVSGVLAPPKRKGLETCVYKPEASAVKLSVGLLDLGFGQTYDAYLMVGNQLIARTSAEQGRSESSRVALQGVTVRVNDSAGNEISAFTRLGSGIVEASEGATPSYGTILTVLIDPTAARIAAQSLQPSTVKRLVAFAKVFGQTLGGKSIESAEFEFPIDVCFRCLVRFPEDTNDLAIQTRTGVRNCKGKSSIEASSPCVLGQDEEFVCSSCPENPVCDPTYEGSAANPSGGSVASQNPNDAGGGG
jgi:hypothetical protein